MSITVDKSPHLLALTGNPMPVKLTTDAVYSVAGVKQIGGLSFYVEPGTNGDTITFEWDTTKSVTFTIVSATPDDSGTQIPVKTGGTTLAWMRDEVVPALRQNALLFEDFNIIFNTTSDLINLVAREEGTRFNITMSYVFASLFPEFEHSTGALGGVSGVDPVVNENFLLRLEIWIADSWDEDNFTKAGTQELVPDAEGSAVFYPNRILQDYTPRCGVSDLLTTIVEDNISVKYFLKYIEYYGDPATVQSVKVSSTLYAYKGGYPQELGADYPTSSGYLLGQIDPSNRYLNQAPKALNQYYYIDEDHVEELLFCSFDASVTQLKLRIIGVLNASPFAFDIEPITLSSIEQYKTYRIPVGFKNLSTHLNTYKDDLLWYGVSLRDQSNNTIAANQVYYYDRSNYENVDYLIFPNSLGAWDSVRLTGPKKIEQESKSEEFGKNIPFDYTAKDSPTSEANYTATKIIEHSTGWLTKAQQKWLAHELQHKDTTPYIVENSKLVAIKMLTENLLVSQTKLDLPSLKLTYKKVFNQNYYAK